MKVGAKAVVVNPTGGLLDYCENQVVTVIKCSQSRADCFYVSSDENDSYNYMTAFLDEVEFMTDEETADYNRLRNL